MRPLPPLLALLVAVGPAVPLQAAGKGRTPVPPTRATYLYTYYDRQGRIIVNNLPPSSTGSMGLVLKQVGVGRVGLAISRMEMAKVLRAPELLAMVDEIAQANGVDPFLARAIIQAESAFYDKARSHAGAMGLMQLMPATALRFGVTDPFDPRQNINGGTKYLKWLMDYFQGDLTKTVAAYNSGERNVEKYRGIPPFAETRAYVPKVIGLYHNKSVQPDPKAAGALDLLKKGRGGFQVEEKVLPAAEAEIARKTPANPLYQWVDDQGRIQISDQPPPKLSQKVRKFGDS
jgi:hypothetical protein